MHVRFVVMCVFATGCVAQAQPQPQYQYAYPPPPAYPQQPVQAPAAQPADPNAASQAAPPQATPVGPAQPAAQPAQPYPPPQPYSPQPYPPPAPYAAQQPYPPPQPYGYPPAAPYGAPSHIHDGEVIGDFALVGGLAAIDVLTKSSFENNSADTLVVLAGIGAGGGVGYLLADNYQIDAGVAHATTAGLVLGAANGALLIQPTGADNGDSVVGLLVVGSALGAAGGFAYGHAAHLTAGQSTFISNMILLGAATSLISVTIQNSYGTAQNTALLVGTDGAAAVGALIAPTLNWSPHRAKVVFAGTMIGAFIGSAVVSLATGQQNNTDSNDANVLAAGLTAGLWGGFALAILATRDDLPDPKFLTGAPPTTAAPAAPMSMAPWVGPQGSMGIMTGGTF